jgi:hypothetical protein
MAILDRRLATYRYADAILRSLPPARRITKISDRRLVAAAAPARSSGD